MSLPIERLKKLIIKERWFNNKEFANLFVHTYLNTKALVLGHKSSIIILMDKRCDILRIFSSSIKETKEEIIKAELMLKEKLEPTTLSPFIRERIKYSYGQADIDFTVTLPIPISREIEYRTLTDVFTDAS